MRGVDVREAYRLPSFLLGYNMSIVTISGTTSKTEEAHASDVQSHAVFPHWSGERLGFRLVNDHDDRVNRGGGWFDDPRVARVADRGSVGPSSRYGFLGFRLCVDWREG